MMNGEAAGGLRHQEASHDFEKGRGDPIVCGPKSLNFSKSLIQKSRPTHRSFSRKETSAKRQILTLIV
jgi:hypothetical protein